jgi:leader peptidase (prepilin peptidase) / N-methyltransferase
MTWASLPLHCWSIAFFVIGAMVGSFLNLCIHRLPLGRSVVSPSPYCPNCEYAIPWQLNIPVASWLYLGGKCRNCGAPIAIRYLLVELLSALAFLGCWLAFGHQSAWLVLVYALFLSGLIIATFTDFEHIMIPDQITVGGMVAGFFCSLILPSLHGEVNVGASLRQSALGIVFGAGIIYAISRGGKLVFGRKKRALPAESTITFAEEAVHLPDEVIPFEDLFYRPSDTIAFRARTLELAERGYKDVQVRLTPDSLRIGDEELNPEDVPFMEAVTTEIILPQEAMGLGDLKFMAAIGAFLGWQGVVFSLVASSFIGGFLVGLPLVLMGRRELSSRLPYGPYIATGATLWIFEGRPLVALFFRIVEWLTRLVLGR